MIIIRRIFNRKISKLSALINLSALAAMFVLLFLFMPEFIATTAGQIFVGVWALIAALSFVANSRSVTSRKGRQYVPVYGIKKTERTSKARSTSSMRGI